MRTFLLTIFWMTSVGSVIQLLVIVFASSIIFSGTYSFSELSISVFVTQFVPWLEWWRSLLVELFGELGRWILALPILGIAAFKFVTGTIIGLWCFSIVKKMPAEPSYA